MRILSMVSNNEDENVDDYDGIVVVVAVVVEVTILPKWRK